MAREGQRRLKFAWLVSFLVVACLILATGLVYPQYLKSSTPHVAVLVDEAAGMRPNDLANEESSLAEILWTTVGARANLTVIGYGKGATVLASRYGSAVTGSLKVPLQRDADVAYPNLPRALEVAQAGLAGSRAPRVVLILTDGFPFPGPQVGTPDVGRIRSRLVAEGILIHAVLFGSIGKVRAPNTGPLPAERTVSDLLAWSGVYEPDTGGLLSLVGALPGAVALSSTGQVTHLTVGERIPSGTAVLLPRDLVAVNAFGLPAFLALLVALIVGLVFGRIRHRRVLWLVRAGDPEHPLVTRTLLPGVTRRVPIRIPGAGKASRTEIAVILRSGRDGWTLESIGGSHLYVGDGLPTKAVRLETEVPVRVGEYMVSLRLRTRRRSRRGHVS